MMEYNANEIIISNLKINRKNLEFSHEGAHYTMTGTCEVFNSREQYYIGIKKLLKKLNKKVQDKYDAESQGNKI